MHFTGVEHVIVSRPYVTNTDNVLYYESLTFC